MKVKKTQIASMTKPLLKDVTQLSKVQSKNTLNKIKGMDSTLAEQPNLYQDGGSGYNANFVFPQD